VKSFANSAVRRCYNFVCCHYIKKKQIHVKTKWYFIDIYFGLVYFVIGVNGRYLHRRRSSPVAAVAELIQPPSHQS